MLIGGGKERFDQAIDGGPYAGKTVVEQAQALGYTGRRPTPAGLDAANAKGPVLGLFSAGQHGPRVERACSRRRSPVTGAAGLHRTNQPARPTSRSLADMTPKAIDLLLDQGELARSGFFLQVEGASIDKQDHAANPCGQIGETIEFDNAIQVALALREDAPEHADHRHRRPRPHRARSSSRRRRRSTASARSPR